MSGFTDLMLGLGILLCALAVVIVGVVGLGLLRFLDTPDRSLVCWLQGVYGRLRAIVMLTLEHLSCRRARRDDTFVVAGDTAATDAEVFELCPGSVGVAATPTPHTQVNSFFLYGRKLVW